MKKAIVTIGISASGKSTFAEEWVAKDTAHRAEINRDAVRKSLVKKEGGTFSWPKWNWKREGEVTNLVQQEIKRCSDNGYDIIVSDTNLSETRRLDLIRSLEFHGYSVEIKEFPVTIEEAIKRDLVRLNSVGSSVIRKQWKDWNKHIGRKTYSPNLNLPRAILVDIDGTVASHEGVRSPFEWDKVILDNPIQTTIDVIKAYAVATNSEIVFMSGRDSICNSDTKIWLETNVTNSFNLYMRSEGDMRKDNIIKEELFWKHIDPYYNILAVFDDRNQVCRMWRDLGLFVFQVGDPDIEF